MKLLNFHSLWLKNKLNELIDNPQELESMSQAAKQIAITTAAERLANAIEDKVIKQEPQNV